MIGRLAWLAALGLAALSGAASAQVQGAERRAILDALRPAVERRLGGPVEFVVRRIDARDGWALVIAEPQRPGGGAIDPRRFFPADALEFMDGLTASAILRRLGGRWRLVEHQIGATDVWYCAMQGPPRALTGC